MTRSDKVAPEEAKVQFRKSWDAWKAWVELREDTSFLCRLGRLLVIELRSRLAASPSDCAHQTQDGALVRYDGGAHRTNSLSHFAQPRAAHQCLPTLKVASEG
jgi:hypothetical protein